MKPWPILVFTAAALFLGGCGVTDQDEPEPITTLAPSTTPTVSSRTAPPSTSPPVTTGSSDTRQVQTSVSPTQ